MTKTHHLINRRDVLTLTAVCATALPTLGCTRDEYEPKDGGDSPTASAKKHTDNLGVENSMKVHYLEFVTKDVDASCGLYSAIHGVTFGDADQSLGGARTTKMPDGGVIGIRAPMHDGENSVTRAYMLVEDIQAAVAAATEAGAKIAVPPMEIPGHGTCAIYFQDGIEAGLWQL